MNTLILSLFFIFNIIGTNTTSGIFISSKSPWHYYKIYQR